MCVESSGHRRHERIGEEERLDRERQAHRRVRLRGEGSAEARLEEEVHEEGEEADLRRAPHPDERADALARRDAGAGELRILLLLLRRAARSPATGGAAVRRRARPSSASTARTRFFSAAAIARGDGGGLGGRGGLGRAGAHVVSRSIGFTAPTSPVFHGIGSTWTCVCSRRRAVPRDRSPRRRARRPRGAGSGPSRRTCVDGPAAIRPPAPGAAPSTSCRGRARGPS